jgi:hypothetical protein
VHEPFTPAGPAEHWRMLVMIMLLVAFCAFIRPLEDSNDCRLAK